MLDIKLIRETPEFVRTNLMKRGDSANIQMLDDLLETDRKWRENLTILNELRHQKKVVTAEVATLKKAGKDAKEKLERAKAVDSEIVKTEQQVAAEEEKEHDLLMRLPNMLHESVPIGAGDANNIVIRTWGKIPTFSFPVKNHIDLALNLDVIDIERAGKVAGSRFYYLKHQGVLLDMALMMFAMEEMVKNGYTPIEPPYLMRREAYEGVTALSDFEDVLYKVENEDLYLIATSEHPMAAMLQNEVLTEQQLPLKLAGISACFRKEAGAHGKDTRGIFRTHQFNKIEQFIFCTPEQSWQLHEDLLKNAENIFRKLELPYRVVNVCTGDIGTVAAKKYDIEAWMPAMNAYREVVSCSNCTDYQARRLNIRYREKEGAPTKGVTHTLNSTAVATGRTIVAILENNQRADGSITIPPVLRKYMNDKETIAMER